MQNTDFIKNIDCFERAVTQSPGTFGQSCEKYENTVYFKLMDYTAQDLNILAT